MIKTEFAHQICSKNFSSHTVSLEQRFWLFPHADELCGIDKLKIAINVSNEPCKNKILVLWKLS